MCALAPFPTPSWPLVINPIGSYEQQRCIYDGSESIESFFLQIPPPPPQEETAAFDDNQSPSFTSCDPIMVKRFNHNASERDRRKKVNSLYSSLGSLLPESDQTKKLSFPATVSRAINYIPELQREVEKLVQKKEKLLLRISQLQGGLKLEEHQRKSRSNNGRCLSSAVSIKGLGLAESEVAIQISMKKAHKNQLSEILQFIEQDGLFLVLNATSFESSGGMVFYNIHLQVERSNCKLESKALDQKLLSLFDQQGRVA